MGTSILLFRMWLKSHLLKSIPPPPCLSRHLHACLFFIFIFVFFFCLFVCLISASEHCCHSTHNWSSLCFHDSKVLSFPFICFSPLYVLCFSFVLCYIFLLHMFYVFLLFVFLFFIPQSIENNIQTPMFHQPRKKENIEGTVEAPVSSRLNYPWQPQ